MVNIVSIVRIEGWSLCYHDQGCKEFMIGELFMEFLDDEEASMEF